MPILELGRPAKMGIMKFTAAEANGTTEKNLEEHVVDGNGNTLDLRLPAGAVGYEMQTRQLNTAPFQVSRYKDQMKADGVFWSSILMGPTKQQSRQYLSELGISVDTGSPVDKLNLYVAATGGVALTIEIRIFPGYS